LAAAFAHEPAESTTAGKVASNPAVLISPRVPLRRAAELMTEHGVTHLVVVDERSNRPVGVISMLDLARVLADEPATS
jgi:CBS domain-containing protein